MTEDKEPVPAAHDDKAFALLPWHVNGTLTEAEAAEVSAHLENCILCQQELATLISLKHAIIATNETLPSPESERLAQVLNRIEDYEAALAGTTHQEPLIDRWRERLYVFWLAWGRAAFAAQFVAILLLVVALVFTTQRAQSFAERAVSEKARADANEQLRKETQQRYETLAGPNNPNGTQGARLTVAFQESATEKGIRELLNGIKGTIVSGPSPQRMYVVALPVAQGADRQRVVDAALNQLRTNPQTVLFVAERTE